MTSPLVSIVIPVYNGGIWLAEAIDSALAQTWLEIEVLVINDGSTDAGLTRKIAESYGDQIRYFEKKNGGVASALNRGIAEMRGAYFSWLSHDDRYLPEKVERQITVLLDRKRPAIACSDVRMIDADGVQLRGADLFATANTTDHPLWWVLEGRLNGCALLIPKVCFEQCGVFDESLPTTQDYDLWFRMAQHFNFVLARGAYVESRLHEGQGSRTSNHLHEAGVLWSRMLETTPAPIMERMAPSRDAYLHRFSKLGPLKAYPGPAAKVNALLKAYRESKKVTVVVDANRPNIFDIRATFWAIGYRALEIIFIDRVSEADPQRLAIDYPQLRRDGLLLTLPADISAADLAAHVAETSSASIVVFYDALTAEGLAAQVVSVEGGAPSAWPNDLSTQRDAALGVLGGLVVRRASLQSALRFVGRSDIAGWMQALAMADWGDWGNFASGSIAWRLIQDSPDSLETIQHVEN